MPPTGKIPANSPPGGFCACNPPRAVVVLSLRCEFYAHAAANKLEGKPDGYFFVTILQLISALILIAVVLFQSGKSQGLSGAIGGIADSYLSKSKAKSVDAKLAKATKWVGAVFVVLTLVLNCMVAAGL